MFGPIARGRHAKRCTRLVAVRGAFTRRRAAGADRLRFTGRIGGRRLRRARYRLVATPRGGAASRAAFRILG